MTPIPNASPKIGLPGLVALSVVTLLTVCIAAMGPIEALDPNPHRSAVVLYLMPVIMLALGAIWGLNTLSQGHLFSRPFSDGAITRKTGALRAEGVAQMLHLLVIPLLLMIVLGYAT